MRGAGWGGVGGAGGECCAVINFFIQHPEPVKSSELTFVNIFNKFCQIILAGNGDQGSSRDTSLLLMSQE